MFIKNEKNEEKKKVKIHILHQLLKTVVKVHWDVTKVDVCVLFDKNERSHRPNQLAAELNTWLYHCYKHYEGQLQSVPEYAAPILCFTGVWSQTSASFRPVLFQQPLATLLLSKTLK